MIDHRYRSWAGRGLALALSLWLTAASAPALSQAATPAPGAAAQAKTQAGPVDVIADFQQALIAAMKGGRQLGFKGRYDKLAPVVRQTHDIQSIVRVAVGKYWDQLSAQQRQELEQNFAKLSISTYASEFDSFSGERFTQPKLSRKSGTRALVDSNLIESGGKTHTFLYQMHETKSGWQIVNIVADGVSDLALKRAEYTSIIQRSGFDALIAKLKQKIDQYEKESA